MTDVLDYEKLRLSRWRLNEALQLLSARLEVARAEVRALLEASAQDSLESHDRDRKALAGDSQLIADDWRRAAGLPARGQEWSYEWATPPRRKDGGG